MKKYLIFILIVCTGLLISTGIYAQNKVTFNVDMSEVKDAKDVGIRGSLSPLSWDKTTLMKGPDKKGIYSVTIDFGDQKPGTMLKYKFIYGDNTWENEFMGATSNRSFILPGTNVKLAPLTFNDLLYFDTDALLESVMQNLFFTSVFYINLANSNGKTSEDCGKNYYNFWKGTFIDWIKDPQQLMFQIKVDQAKYPFGEFQIIENKQGYVKFKFNKPWDIYLGYFGKDGIFKDVTEDEISAFNKIYFKHVAKELNWKFNWEEDDKWMV
jgi:hypothetical protein